MPKLFITGILLILLLAAAGSSQTAQARYIPWDCSDWQAFAHSDRATAILESLAENRGKTLYCGIDQSDTFAKAETWEAGRDHNERDDTVYYGERGRFRGFIAAQEGWLTDGESGITGQSIAVIFEFPKEERGRRRTKRFNVGSGPVTSKTDNTCMTDLQEGRQPGTLICTGWGGWSANFNAHTHETPRKEARHFLVGIGGGSTYWDVEWDTQQVYRTSMSGRTPEVGTFAYPSAEQWLEMAKDAALSTCRARGAQQAVNVAFGPGHSDDRGTTAATNAGPNLGWFFQHRGGTAYNGYRARQSRTWSATCVKKGPRQDR